MPKAPRLATLRKYGLTQEDWVRMCEACGHKCVVCGEDFGERPLVVDHEHAKGFKARKWKRKNGKAYRVRVMGPEERRKYVRGVLHAYCNRFVRSWLTLPRAKAIVLYLEAFERTRVRQEQDQPEET